MKTKVILLATFILFILIGCKNNSPDEQEKCQCPMFDVVTMSPYQDPVCHPSGKFVGFNYKPIKQIKYTYGYDCPRQANYKYAEDSVGFWLVDIDGTRQRRILPYKLQCPAWSPDGKWIAFSSGAQICMMPFDGEKFDTAAVQVLTTEGRNFFPSWSPDGKKIAYEESICTELIPCGVWIHELIEHKNSFIARYGGFTSWFTNEKLFFIKNVFGKEYNDIGDDIYQHDFMSNTTQLIKEIRNPNYDNRYLSFSSNKKYIAIISMLSTGGVYLFRMNADGSNLIKLTEEFTQQFSWVPDGRIVYLNHDYSRLDKTKGALWIMNADGSNKKPLTFNNPKIIY